MTKLSDYNRVIESSKPTHLSALDGVRGLAALMIMFFHFMPAQYDKVNHPILYFLKKISIFGQCGVPLFFVLSGFLITRILLNSRLYNNYFKIFYLKRALRIFPLYYLYLILTFYILPLIFGQEMVNWNMSWYYFFYMQNFAMTFNWKIADAPHLWSLAVEEHFYLLWPFIIYYFSNRAILKIIGIIVILALACRVFIIHLGYGVYYFTFAAFDSLAIGAFLAFNQKYKFINRRGFYLIMVSSAIPLVVFFVLFTGEGNDYIQYFKTLVISVFCMTIIGLITLNDPYLSKIFKNFFLSYTGKISYGLYVFHSTCFGLVYMIIKPGCFVSSLFFCFFAAYLIATLSYYLFEQWFLRIKDRLSSQIAVKVRAV